MTTSNKSTPGKNRPSLYEQIGGEKAILDASRTFVARLRKDTRTSKAFSKLDETKQARMLAGFIAHVTGGPAHTGPSMYEFHRELCLSDAHYDTYLAILEESLMDCDFEKQAVQKVMQEVREQRDEVLGKGKKGSCLMTMMNKCCASYKESNVYVQAAGATVVVGTVALIGFLAYKALRKQN